jgi:hypothetical protein
MFGLQRQPPQRVTPLLLPSLAPLASLSPPPSAKRGGAVKKKGGKGSWK